MVIEEWLDELDEKWDEVVVAYENVLRHLDKLREVNDLEQSQYPNVMEETMKKSAAAQRRIQKLGY